jgi:hypothetical protein
MQDIKRIIKALPGISLLVDQHDQALSERDRAVEFVPPGHFYSPIPSIEDVMTREKEIWRDQKKPHLHGGIDWNEEHQLALMEQFKNYYRDQPFGAYWNCSQRFYFENPSYSYSDAIFLYCFIRHLKPKRIIEVGSGFSSGLMMDTNQLLFGNSMSVTCIDPYPEVLRSVILPGDANLITLIEKPVWEVGSDVFTELRSRDILFIDSTHVSKIGSDVNYLFFEILPVLSRGVHIHFHDVFHSFEYPRQWILGVCRITLYILRSLGYERAA